MPQTEYQKKKARAVEMAQDFQSSFAEGRQWSYGELAEVQKRFEKLGKRYGLLREFRENGII